LITAEMARRRYGRPSATFEPAYLWRDVLRAGLPFAMMNLFSIVYFRSGSLLLSWLTRSDALVGFYNAGYRLVEAFMFFPTVLTTPLYPVLARRWPEGKALSPVLLRTVRLVLAGSILIVFPIVAWRVEITRLLFGEAFLPAAMAVGLISLAMLPVGMNFVFGSLVAASGRQSRGNVMILAVTVANVLLNLALIPRYGLAGAAAVTVATELLLAIGNWSIVREFLDTRGLVRLGARSLAAVALAGATAWMVRGLAFPWSAATSVAVLAGALVALGLIRLEDRSLVLGGAAPADAPPPAGDGSR
jgi:O-antigen/teichoic acid export membrane protein